MIVYQACILWSSLFPLCYLHIAAVTHNMHSVWIIFYYYFPCIIHKLMQLFKACVLWTLLCLCVIYIQKYLSKVSIHHLLVLLFLLCHLQTTAVVYNLHSVDGLHLPLYHLQTTTIICGMYSVLNLSLSCVLPTKRAFIYSVHSVDGSYCFRYILSTHHFSYSWYAFCP